MDHHELSALAQLVSDPIHKRMDDIRKDIATLREDSGRNFQKMNDRLSNVERDIGDIRKNGVSTRPYTKRESTALVPKKPVTQPFYSNPVIISIIVVAVIAVAALAAVTNRPASSLVPSLPTKGAAPNE